MWADYDIEFVPAPVQAFIAKRSCKLCGQGLIGGPYEPMSEWFSNSLIAGCAADDYSLEVKWKVASDILVESEHFHLSYKDTHYDLHLDFASQPVEVEIVVSNVSGDKDISFPPYKHFADLISKDRISGQELIDRIEAVRLLQ
jgi:hypothetical protein